MRAPAMVVRHPLRQDSLEMALVERNQPVQTLSDEARTIIGAFIDRYNHQGLIERLDHRIPATARLEMLLMAA